MNHCLCCIWRIHIIVLLAAACVAPAGEAVAHGAPTPIAVTDFRGKQVVLGRPANRIVCLIESALSGLYMLGAEERLVGVPTGIYQGGVYAHYAGMDARIANKTLPAPGNWDFVNLERLVALEPDLVLVWSHQEEPIRAMEERGIPVFAVFIGSFDDIHREILALGDLTGTSARARQLVDDTRRELAGMASRIAEARSRPRVYFMWAQGERETSGRNSTVHELITLAGGENVSGAIDKEHLVVNMERIIAWNPEVIVMWPNDRKSPQDILQNPQWQSVRAVEERRVHEFPDSFSCDLWTLKFQYALRLVAAWCHPHLFTDEDLARQKQAILWNLYGGKYRYPFVVE